MDERAKKFRAPCDSGSGIQALHYGANARARVVAAQQARHKVGSALRCELKRQAAAIALQLVNPVRLDWVAVAASPDCAEQRD